MLAAGPSNADWFHAGVGANRDMQVQVKNKGSKNRRPKRILDQKRAIARMNQRTRQEKE
jgi:hypothetical protein